MKLAHYITTFLFTIGLVFGTTLTTENALAKSSEEKESKATEIKKEEKRGSTSAATVEKKEEKSPQKKTVQTTPGTISINKASRDELMNVPGIGPKKADAIIEYRKNTPFKSVDDLLKVKGIGEKSLAKMRQYLKL